MASLSPAAHYSTLTLPAFSSRVPMATPVSPYHSSIAPPPPTFSEPGCTCILPFPDSPIHQHTAERRSGLAFIAPYMCHCVCRSVCVCVCVCVCMYSGRAKQIWAQKDRSLLQNANVSFRSAPNPLKNTYMFPANETRGRMFNTDAF